MQVLAIQTVMNVNSPRGDLEDDTLDFALETLRLLDGTDPACIAEVTSGRVIDTHGGSEAYGRALSESLSRKPVWHVGWSKQPRAVADDTCKWQVELLFDGENPLKRARTLRLVKDGETVRLDTDIVALALDADER